MCLTATNIWISLLILRRMKTSSQLRLCLWGWTGQQMELSRENVMQIQKIARGIQAEDYPLQFILSICSDTCRYSVK